MAIRLGLGLGVVLILIVYGIGFRVLNLRVGVPGHVEVWLAFCIMLVLASVIEFIFVHIFLKAFSTHMKKTEREKIGTHSRVGL